MERKMIISFAEIFSNICYIYNSEHLTIYMDELLFSQKKTALQDKIMRSTIQRKSELLNNGNIRSDNNSFATPAFASYLLNCFDSSPQYFENLLIKCRLRLKTDDETRKFVANHDYFESVLSKLNNWKENVKHDKEITPLMEEFCSLLEFYLSEKEYPRIISMLIIFSFLNYDAFYLNHVFKRINYNYKPAVKLENDAEYIIKPYMAEEAHLAVRSQLNSINRSTDRSCIQKKVLVASSDCNMSYESSVFRIKKIRGNTYYIMHGDRYLQYIGILSNNRLVSENELGYKCRWRIRFVADSDAFVISPVSTNYVVNHFYSLDVPNGSPVDNLKLWLFFSNNSTSQMFRFHKII